MVSNGGTVMRNLKLAILTSAALAVSSMASAAVFGPNGPTDGKHIISATWAGGSWSGPGTYFGANDSGVDQGYNGQTVPVGLHDGRYSAQVMAFALPALPAGEEFTSIDFSVVHAYNDTGASFNVPLTVLGVVNRGWVQFDDYERAGTVIQSDFLRGGLPNWTRIDTSAAADESLANYVNADYVAGNFLLVRLAIPSDQPNWQVYRIMNTDGGTGGPAQMTFTTAPVPEPAMLGLIGVAGVALMRRRQA